MLRSSSACSSTGVSRRGCAHQFHANGDGYVVADHAGSSINSEVLAIDLGTGGGAHMELPFGSCTGTEGPSTSRTTSLVTPWMVRSPVIFSLPVPAASTRLDLNVSVGYLATVEEVGAAQVVVTPFHARVNGAGVDGCL